MSEQASNKPITFDALTDHVVILPDPKVTEKTTTTGIIIQGKAVRTGTRSGKVVAAGPGRITETGHLRHPRVAVGNRVHFGEHAGSVATIDDVEYVILREGELMLIDIEPKEAAPA